ncbi:hypothetical protein G6F56_001901 [Rhizopus delemar]|uniref:DUF1264 domain protein n=1 Tax=Rhizopus stolonifer TaxID=4846 RepID=A0A367KUQ5_RHIST|nr:hypothetical protein G6F56_001901 [Rhizopus delemar]RCI05612.1 hypothetical protein CU098_013610 [Rhizopus stolonifer]
MCDQGKTSNTRAGLELASNPAMSFKPMNGICESFCGIHPYSNDTSRQVISYHYCHMIDEDRRQCLVYDSDSSDAKLIAIEYIISEALFTSLPDKEKKFWHSHKYEVESGLLCMTGKSMVPDAVISTAEKPSLEILVNTYGKTWQLWPVDNEGNCSSKVPYGPPQLLMSFTADGQVKPEMIERRDKQMGISTEKKRKEREDIKGNPVAHGADHWEKGDAFQIPADI